MKIEEGKYYKANYTVDNIEDNLLTGIVLEKEKIDWNSIRTQAAIAAMQGMISNHDLMCSLRSGDEKEKKFSPYICINVTTKLAEKATKYADALIAELKKGE